MFHGPGWTVMVRAGPALYGTGALRRMQCISPILLQEEESTKASKQGRADFGFGGKVETVNT